MNATLKTIVILAALVAGAAHGQEVVLRWETANEADARRGIARGLDASSAEGYAEFLRLTTPPADMTPEQAAAYAAKAQVERIKTKGKQAGRNAVAKAGVHAPKLKDADVMRRAKAAAKGEKLADSDVDTFISEFAAVFTTARMNAR